MYSCYAPIDSHRGRPAVLGDHQYNRNQFELGPMTERRRMQTQPATVYTPSLDDNPDFQQAVVDSKTLVLETGKCVCSKDVNKEYDLIAIPSNGIDYWDSGQVMLGVRDVTSSGGYAQVLLNPTIVPWEQSGMMLIKHSSLSCMQSSGSNSVGSTLSNLYNKIDVVYETPKRYGKITVTLQKNLAYCVQLKRFNLDGKLPPTSRCL